MGADLHFTSFRSLDCTLTEQGEMGKLQRAFPNNTVELSTPLAPDSDLLLAELLLPVPVAQFWFCP